MTAADPLATTYRSHLCGSLRREHAGSRVRLGGWVHRARNLGGIVFIDLRDRAGLVQVKFDPEVAPADVLALAGGLGAESVVVVEGDVVERPAELVVLELELAPRYGYPFHLRSRVTYRLSAEDGLSVDIRTTNIGERTAPYGSSTHPYLTCDLRPVDECVLRAPAETVLTVDDRLRPVATVPASEAGLALAGNGPLGDTQIDHAYTGLPDGGWTVTLADEALEVRLHADAPWLQIYSGELVGRRGVAVEPMTCPPDAFNSGTDLVELAPGDSHSLTLRIDAAAV